MTISSKDKTIYDKKVGWKGKKLPQNIIFDRFLFNFLICKVSQARGTSLLKSIECLELDKVVIS